jgi:hypothetical protein
MRWQDRLLFFGLYDHTNKLYKNNLFPDRPTYHPDLPTIHNPSRLKKVYWTATIAIVHTFDSYKQDGTKRSSTNTQVVGLK